MGEEQQESLVTQPTAGNASPDWLPDWMALNIL